MSHESDMMLINVLFIVLMSYLVHTMSSIINEGVESDTRRILNTLLALALIGLLTLTKIGTIILCICILLLFIFCLLSLLYIILTGR